jgi:hypothetical protein
MKAEIMALMVAQVVAVLDKTLLLELVVKEFQVKEMMAVVDLTHHQHFPAVVVVVLVALVVLLHQALVEVVVLVHQVIQHGVLLLQAEKIAVELIILLVVVAVLLHGIQVVQHKVLLDLVAVELAE